MNRRTLLYCFIAALTGIAAFAAFNGPGCATGKLAPHDATAGTPTAIVAQADNAHQTGTTLAATAPALEGHAAAIVAATSTSDAAATSAKAAAPAIAPQMATVAKANATIRTEAAGVSDGAGKVDTASKDVFDYETSLKNANAALAKLQADVATAKEAQKKAEDEVAAANGVIATKLRIAAEWCAGLGALLLAAMFFVPVPFKPNLFEVVAAFVAAAVLTSLSIAWAEFVATVHAHPVWTIAIIVGIVAACFIAFGRAKGWFTAASAYIENWKAAAITAAPAVATVGAQVDAAAASTTGPLYTYFQHLAEKDRVKVLAWTRHLLHKDVSNAAADHATAVAAVQAAAVVPITIPAVVAVNPTQAAPAATP